MSAAPDGDMQYIVRGKGYFMFCGNNNSCIWIIIILLVLFFACGGCGCGNNDGCGCGCGNNNGCGC